MAQALRNIADGKSLKVAIQAWGIPYQILRDQVNGGENHSDIAKSQQRLSRTQKDHLASWVLTQELLGVPLNYSQIREFANYLPKIKDNSKEVRKHQIQDFQRRNSILQTKKTWNIDSVYINRSTTKVIRPWFQWLSLPEIQGIKPENRWNMDKAGIMEGLGVNRLVVRSSKKRGIY